MTMNNSNTNTTTKLPLKTNRHQVAFLAQMTSLGFLGTIIILGNLISIITFIKTKSLRRRSYYLIICLAAADLLVGVVVFLMLFYFLPGQKSNTFVMTLDFLDTLAGMTSILMLSAISVELFSAIVFPFRHRKLSFKVYVAMSVFPWILATGLAVMDVIGHFKPLFYYTFLYVCFVVIALALLTISSSYLSMGCKMSCHHDVNQIRALRDKKLVVTLLIVTLSSLLTWMPLKVYILVESVCKKCSLPDVKNIFIINFVQFCNSGLNIFIYMVRMADFRAAFLALFCRRERTLRRPNITQKTNPSFLDEEETGAARRTMGQANESNDFKVSDHSTFNSPAKDTDKPKNSNSNQNPKTIHNEYASERKASQKKTETSMEPHHYVAKQDKNYESETPEILCHNYNTSSKYETAEVQDTAM